jgi:hypothetical protein
MFAANPPIVITRVSRSGRWIRLGHVEVSLLERRALHHDAEQEHRGHCQSQQPATDMLS